VKINKPIQLLVFVKNFSYTILSNKFLNKKRMKKTILSLLLTLAIGFSGFAQVTTSTISGVVKSEKGETLPGATVQIVHIPTGTKYGASTNQSGRYVVPAVRVGGPYKVVVSFVGFKQNEQSDVNTSLGVTTNVDVVLVETNTSLKEVVVTGGRNNIFSKEKTGASQQFSRRELQSIPIVGARTIDGITKYNPFGNGNSFGAQDSRLNNFTIDGSQFNNNFGLGSSAQAGGRTGASAISLDAIEQLQVNVAPFDIRQSGFTGAGINAVTRSGTNEVEGSVYQTQRNNSSTYIGDNARGTKITPSKFDEKVQGFRLGAPIIKNKLFIFGNYEGIQRTEPGTTWISTGSPLAGSQVSRPTFQQLTDLSKFMQDKFNYSTGPFEGYSNTNTSDKFLVRVDWNINDKNKLTARYVFHNSEAQINISNSQSAGFGNRTQNINAMSFQNSGYTIQDNTRSAVLELNSKISNTLHNNLIVSYDKQIENRGYMSQMFPTIDILQGSTTLTSVGFDPFTPGNKLDYSTFNVTNNLTKYLNKHTLVGGFNFQSYESNNLFFPASNGVYIFNSLADFYTAANQSLANGGRPSTFAPARFQFRYSALPGAIEPMQTLRSNRLDLYLQDEYDATDNLKLTFGIRTNIIGFDNTALENPVVSAMTFANGERWNTGVMPKTQVLFEPRLGFNYNLKGESKTQFRGGTGVFTGRPPYVFLSNQIGNNGVLTGFIDVSGAAAAQYGFTANPNQYFIPSTPTLPSTFDLALTDPDYKFPQVWKTNLAVDQKLPFFGLVASAEYLYNQTLNAVHYYEANLRNPVGTLGGVDNRPRFGGSDATVRVNNNVSRAAVLTNRDGAFHESLTLKLEKLVQKGFWGSVAWTTANSKDFMSAGSIASGSWQSALSVNGNNDLGLSFADQFVKNRFVGLLGYRIEYGGNYGGATTFTLGYVGQQGNPFSYIAAGDLNGDRVNNNDLIFVPQNGSDIRFAPLTVGTRVYTEAEQQAAFDKFIDQDPYLSTRRGQYAERNGGLLPYLHRFDLSVAQDIFVKIGGKRNAFQIRADILNFGNLVDNQFGVSQRATAPQILNFVSRDANNVPSFRLATQRLTDGSTILARDSYQYNSSVFDVWSAQLGIRYIFGR
jgi:hypothetical protein